MQNVWLNSVSYALGDAKFPYSKLEGFTEFMASQGIPELPAVFGWGDFYCTTDYKQMLQTAIRETMQQTSVEPNAIDTVFLAFSSCGVDLSVLRQDLAGVLCDVGVSHAEIVAMTLAECASGLNAAIHAHHLVTNGVKKNVLLVCLDVLPADRTRYNSFAIFSDACVSMIVSSECHSGYMLTSFAREFDAQEIVNGIDMNKVETRSQQPEHAGASKLMSNNLYTPIKILRDGRLGFSKDQLFLANVARFGHCSTCDSFINLVDYGRDSDEPDGRFALNSEASGCSISLMLTASG